jgi:hypothetical protein
MSKTPNKQPKRITLDDWYTNEEARKRLSENSGREIDKNYPRTLARYGKIASIDIVARGKLYLKKDVDAYVVDTKRGRKSSQQKEVATPESAA